MATEGAGGTEGGQTLYYRSLESSQAARIFTAWIPAHYSMLAPLVAAPPPQVSWARISQDVLTRPIQIQPQTILQGLRRKQRSVGSAEWRAGWVLIRAIRAIRVEWIASEPLSSGHAARILLCVLCERRPGRSRRVLTLERQVAGSVRSTGMLATRCRRSPPHLPLPDPFRSRNEQCLIVDAVSLGPERDGLKLWQFGSAPKEDRRAMRKLAMPGSRDRPSAQINWGRRCQACP
jgi:hypothetical protein